VSFANANGVTWGINGNTITASIAATASVMTTPISVFSQWAQFDTNYTVTAGVVSYQKVSLPMPISAANGVVVMDLSGHSNSSGGVTFGFAAYAISGQTASAVTTASGAFTWSSGSETTASSLYGGVSGTRYRDFAWGVSMTPGDYLVALSLTTANDGTVRIFGRQGVNIVGMFASADANYFLDGVSAVTTAAFPLSVVATDTGYVRTGLSARQQPGWILFGTT
jgi:hypothetical protein